MDTLACRGMLTAKPVIFVPTDCDRIPELCPEFRNFDADGQTGRSLVVYTLLPRTAASHGMTWEEIKHLDGAVRYMERHGAKLWFLTVQPTNDHGEPDAGAVRQIVERLATRIVRDQGRAGLPRWWARCWETTGGLHAHIIFAGSADTVRKLRKSPFGPLIKLSRVYNSDRLTRDYLAKERTPQANFGPLKQNLGRRRRGSHCLPGGGDRVQLSRDLKIKAIEAGYVLDWARTSASRTGNRTRRRPVRKSKPYAAISRRANDHTACANPVGLYLPGKRNAGTDGLPYLRPERKHGSALLPAMWTTIQSGAEGYAGPLPFRTRRHRGISGSQIGTPTGSGWLPPHFGNPYHHERNRRGLRLRGMAGFCCPCWSPRNGPLGKGNYQPLGP